VPDDTITVLWATYGTPTTVPETVGRTRVHVARVTPRGLQVAALAALERGPVVAVVGDRTDVARALGLGIDEAVCESTLREREAELVAAIERARFRAVARMRRDDLLRDAAHRDDIAPLCFLTSALGHEMNNPITAAALNCEVLRTTMGKVAQVYRDLFQCAERGEALPAREIERMVATLASAAPAEEIDSIVQDIQTCVLKASNVVRRMCLLAAEQEIGEETDICRVALEFASLVRRELDAVAVFTVETDASPCEVVVPRAWVLQIIAAFLSNAVEAVQAAPRETAHIELRILQADGVVLIEVTDDGIGMSPDVRRRALDPFFTTRRPNAVGLGLTIALAYVRRVGGEILLESEETIGTVAREYVLSLINI
jgi:signal transduction histidine kinase